MARTKSKVCDVTGLKTSEKNFYKNQRVEKNLKVNLASQQK